MKLLPAINVKQIITITKMNIKSLLSKISYRSIFRSVVFFLMGIEFGYFLIGIYLGKTIDNLHHLNLFLWMGIALFFEAQANKLLTQNKNLQEFLDNPAEDEQ
jgi:hypothetical protein